MNLGADYKAFDLSIVLQGVGNYTVYDGPRAGLESMTGTDNQSVLPYWTGGRLPIKAIPCPAQIAGIIPTMVLMTGF